MQNKGMSDYNIVIRLSQKLINILARSSDYHSLAGQPLYKTELSGVMPIDKLSQYIHNTCGYVKPNL